MIINNKNFYVEKIYQNIVKISRSKFFYLDYELDDSFETRFDLVIFHSFMIFYYYKSKKIKNSDIAQGLFDHMFNDFENNLREMGFGDIAVNKKMKVFIKAFYGRLYEYSKSLDKEDHSGDKSLLEQTILNNIYKGNKLNKKFISKFAEYMIENVNNYKSKSEDENLNYNFEFLEFS